MAKRTRRTQFLFSLFCLAGEALFLAAYFAGNAKSQAELKVAVILMTLLFVGSAIWLLYSCFVKTPRMTRTLLDAVSSRPNEIVSACHHVVYGSGLPDGQSGFPIGSAHSLRVTLADKSKIVLAGKLDSVRAALQIVWDRAPHSIRETTIQGVRVGG